MADVPTSPAPGNLTVPPLFGWEAILVVLAVLLAVLVAVAVVVVLAGALRTGATGRSEWQAYLDARSREPAEPPETRVHPGPGGRPE